jgi:hypothetical protein
MITTHMWTGWWEPNEHDSRPTYGPCETVPCNAPRSQHENSEPARRRTDEHL